MSLTCPVDGKYMICFMFPSWERYRRDSSVQPPPHAEVLEGEDEYEVEQLLDHRRVKLRGPSPYEYWSAGQVTIPRTIRGNHT